MFYYYFIYLEVVTLGIEPWLQKSVKWKEKSGIAGTNILNIPCIFYLFWQYRCEILKLRYAVGFISKLKSTNGKKENKIVLKNWNTRKILLKFIKKINSDYVATMVKKASIVVHHTWYMNHSCTFPANIQNIHSDNYINNIYGQ